MAVSKVEAAKKLAAYAAVNEFIKSGPQRQVLGIGSGSTIVYAIDRLVQRVQKENLNVICVPTSYQARDLLKDAKLHIGSIDQFPAVDVAIDGADEIDIRLNSIKGGGGCHLFEKIVASSSNKFVIICDYRKKSEMLATKWRKGIPVEVIPAAHEVAKLKMTALGAVGPRLRMSSEKAGPVVTDSGNLIIDADFGTIPLDKVSSLHTAIKLIPGVVETGLFPNDGKHLKCVKAFVGMEDGSVQEIYPAPSLPTCLSWDNQQKAASAAAPSSTSAPPVLSPSVASASTLPSPASAVCSASTTGSAMSAPATARGACEAFSPSGPIGSVVWAGTKCKSCGQPKRAHS
eukprot:g54997.t1